MNKTEFLQELREKLAEELSPAAVNSHIQYYDSYIIGAMNAGKSEADVLDELGDPLLIAHTILDAQEAGSPQYEEYASQTSYEDTTDHSSRQTTQDTASQDTGHRSFFGGSQYGCLIAAIILIVIVVSAVSLVGSVVSFLWPIIVPVLIIVLIFSLFKSKR